MSQISIPRPLDVESSQTFECKVKAYCVTSLTKQWNMQNSEIYILPQHQQTSRFKLQCFNQDCSGLFQAILKKKTEQILVVKN